MPRLARLQVNHLTSPAGVFRTRRLKVQRTPKPTPCLPLRFMLFVHQSSLHRIVSRELQSHTCHITVQSLASKPCPCCMTCLLATLGSWAM